MVITDKEFAEKIHILIHSARLIPNYNPTNFEKQVSKYVLERFSDSCDDCKKISEALKANPPQPKQSIFKKIGDAINNT